MTTSPLRGPPPPEVPLQKAPLVRVIAQARFPLVASVEKRDFIAPFQEAVRDEYPVMRQTTSNRVLLNLPGQGPVDMGSTTLWRFHGLAHPWRLTLAADFLALETTRYTRRQDFLDRFERLLVALEAHIRPGTLDRLGVRYIDRLTGAALESLTDLVRPPLLGLLHTPVGDQARQAVSESLFELPDEGGTLRVRCGLLPPDSTVDPNAIEPVDAPSWVLDLDAFRQDERPFHAREAAAEAAALARRCYAFFRWSVTEAFLERFGGTP